MLMNKHKAALAALCFWLLKEVRRYLSLFSYLHTQLAAGSFTGNGGKFGARNGNELGMQNAL